MGKNFLNTMKKHFPKMSKLNKTLKKSAIWINHIFQKHDNKIINKKLNTGESLCILLAQKWMSFLRNGVYQAKVKNRQRLDMIYSGTIEGKILQLKIVLPK